MRADQLLVHQGLAASRSQAQRLIASGVEVLQRNGWQAVGKSDELPETAELRIVDSAEARYVSRGGLKLEAALRDCGVCPTGLFCLDVGQSTGGFTDCLLRHGAAHVVGVEVGHGQVHARLRSDPRVSVMEGLNLRESASAIAIEKVAADIMNKPTDGINTSKFDSQLPSTRNFDLVVGDVSFISQTLLAPQIARLLRTGGELLMLVKPQFELQPHQIGKGGIVKGEPHYAEVQAKVCAAWQAFGMNILNYLPSAIAGGDGNREFFVHAAKA